MDPEITFEPIGLVHSPFSEQRGTPIQPACAEGSEGTIEIYPKYAPAVADLAGFDRIWVIFLLHRAGPYRPRVVPYRDDTERGLFATRAPSRPNPLGLSAVRLLEAAENVLRVADLDILDGTPVLDIKPYIPAFDAHPEARAGWFDQSQSRRERADNRFR